LYTELISSVPAENQTFISRNFTDAEIAYCRAQPSFQASFAARWVGKEAVFKSLGVSSRGAGAAMKEIEILPSEAGAPEVTLHGEAKAAAAAKGICMIHLSLSHSDVSSRSRSRGRLVLNAGSQTVAIAFAQASTV
jgi:phosphopantetheine--protein transferase-like protein